MSRVYRHFGHSEGFGRSYQGGAHTLISSQETCFVTGLLSARQLGADYPLEDADARKWFNFYGRMMDGRRFRES